MFRMEFVDDNEGCVYNMSYFVFVDLNLFCDWVVDDILICFWCQVVFDDVEQLQSYGDWYMVKDL